MSVTHLWLESALQECGSNDGSDGHVASVCVVPWCVGTWTSLWGSCCCPVRRVGGGTVHILGMRLYQEQESKRIFPPPLLR